MDTATYLEDLVSSIENLPNELQHILGEILERDTEQWQLKSVIKEARVKIHSLVAKGNGEAPGVDELALIQQVQQTFKQLDTFSDDKAALAERALGLMEKTLRRVDVDLRKLAFELEIPIEQFGLNNAAQSAQEEFDASSSVKHKKNSSSSHPNRLSSNSVSVRSHTKHRLYDDKQDAIVLDLMNSSATSQEPVKNSPKSSTHPGQVPEYSPTGASKEKLKRNDAFGKLRGAGGGANPDNASDEGLYCHCNQPSYGAMVACDAPNCPIEWFHLGCVGLAELPPQGAKWYCQDCLAKAKLLQTSPENLLKTKSHSITKKHNL